MSELIYPELSYRILGLAFKVFNENGYGLSEKFYQQSFAEHLSQAKISYEREMLLALSVSEKIAGKYYADFVVEDKIVLELKVVARFGYVHIKQAMDYLKNGNYKLAILLYFTRDGVKYRRILNNSVATN